MGLLLKYTLITIFWLTAVAANAELTKNMFDIRHLGYSEGLSSQRVFSIVEDQHSAIWVATKIGIDRYNGEVVKSYTLPGNFYHGDMAGRRLRLWYDEHNGLWAYDHTGRIFQYSTKDDAFELKFSLGEAIGGEIILNKVFIDKKGCLWMGLSKGLYKKEKEGNIVTVLDDRYVNDIVADSSSVYVGTSTGVVKLTSQQEANWLVKEEDVQSLYYHSADQELWIGTFNNGLWALNLDNLSLLSLKGKSSGFLNPIRAITAYDTQTMLVGVDGGGVYTVDLLSKEPHLLMSTEDSTDIYLRGNGIYAVTTDRQGNIWIGSYSGGVSVAIRAGYPTRILKHERGNQHSVANNNINGIEEDSNGDLWFATDNGISILNESANTWHHVLQGTVVVTLCRAHSGNIWAGTYGDGVYLLDQKGQRLQHLTQQQEELTTNYIFSIRQDPDGDIWLGGHNGWLMLLDKEGRHKQTYDIKWIHSIEIVSPNQVGVATVNGFYLVNKVTNTVKRYASFPEFQNQNASAYIISMLFNEDQTVWLGTEGGGLNLYNLSTGETRIFTTREGLPSDDVYSLQKDALGRLWMSTAKGLALMKNNEVSNLNYLGDVDKEYNKSAFARLSDGRFAYGSTNGAVLVKPEAIAQTDYEARLRLTGLAIDYLDSEKEKIWRPVLHDMVTRGAVELPYRHNSFAIHFESINYRFQRDINYQHILEGYDKTWSNSSPDGTLRYTNVAPGTYLLKVRNLRRSNGEIIEEKNLFLTVAEPWWNTWWARIIYLAMAGSVLYFIFRYNSNKLQKKHDEDKIKFFINTAHDIRTPVTLIMAPLEDLGRVSGLSDKAQYYLDMARNNTQKLNTLITQLLEFEKVDITRQKISLYPMPLNSILEEEIVGFQSYCDNKQLHLNLNLPDEEVGIKGDRQLLGMLLDNLLSNACKYTPPRGEVSLALAATKRKAIITVRDSGMGIPKKSQKYLFKKVYRAENAQKSQEKGTGFGLLQVHRIVKILGGKISVQSEEDQGTAFTILLPRTYDRPELVPEPSFAASQSVSSEHPRLASQEQQGITKHKGEQPGDTLLIVEDNETLRYYLRHTFDDEYRVIDVANGQEALDSLSNEYPDLILSDVMMPGIQGDELCRMVKDNPDTAGIPFVLLTAKATHDATVEGLKKGADDYIPKPFSTEILKLKIQGLIENRKRQRAFFMRQALRKVGAKKEESRCEQESPTTEEVVPGLSENDRNFVDRATHLVIDNISNTDFTIDILCREMAMSRTLFYNRLKSLTGKSPQEFIRLIRLQKSAELLKSGKNVTETAIDCGFVNPKYFSSLFKQHFGVQPSKYQ
ncbi:two-component regulator propeller domain-containing protein [Marinilabilia sp.]|uniref:hybrid sensor histidine kinase/response regulator transcription factor n=1 Tax=Marinilabilia sp. TaxID=2021252 RepID=UPI0025C101E4|nr:two-component regulator propeller domain-containing protein [Marinilabilia sp.]